MPKISHVPAFRDNYIWFIHAKDEPEDVLIVDPGDAAPVLDRVGQEGLVPRGILLTHHHRDHIGGAATLRERFDVPVFGPAEAGDVVTELVREGSTFRLAGLDFTVMEIPGHTLGHVAFVTGDALFCGDTLFSAGCGRLFEGTPEKLLHSLERLAALPETTRVFCGHEYTLANLTFAAAAEPGNDEIAAWRRQVEALRQQGEPSLPSSIARERQVNPFLRIEQPGVIASVERWSGNTLSDKVRRFAALRRWKDEFQ
ncbi:MAG TPA: hydroxyacylglutathione hydrolase [Gammaproteobacteria bacterium]|nr:hydroxyacylglutathione hydrolase [Gammaproteobacteria bacterium]